MKKELCDPTATYEYKLWIRDELLNHKLEIETFPDLNIVYKSYQNNLCISRYSDAMCVWEGDLRVTLIVNGETITLNDHDARNHIVRKVGDYEFQGDQAIVIDRSRDKTYLTFTIHKCRGNVLRYNLSQPFIIEHNENVTTGYKLSEIHSSGLELISDTFSNQCKPNMTGCGGIRTYVFRGAKRGRQTVTLTYGRSWDPRSNILKTYQIDIV